MRFEWDPEKDLINIKKHGIDFTMAFEEHAQNGHGVERHAARASEFLSSLAARSELRQAFLIKLKARSFQSVHRRSPVGFAPVTRWHALPRSESAGERVRVFVAQEVGGLVELKDGVAQVIASHLMTGLVEELLEA
jgi:hypothetical protein